MTYINRKKATANFGGVNIGFGDGHARRMLAEEVVGKAADCAGDCCYQKCVNGEAKTAGTGELLGSCPTIFEDGSYCGLSGTPN